MLPAAKVEPIAVITIKLICPAAKPIALGIVNLTALRKPGSEKFKTFLGMNPTFKRIGI